MPRLPSVATIESLESRRFLSVTLPTFAQTNLVSDQPGMAAHTDSNLVDSWGIAENPAGVIWIANNVSGTSTAYDSSGNTVAPPVTIPGPTSGTTAALTGEVLNSGRNFVLSSSTGSGPAEYLFGTEDGTIAGWTPALNSNTGVLVVNGNAAGAVYKGLALAGAGKKQQLFAANFGQGRVDVFNSKFNPVALPAGAFTDPKIPSGFAPFNIQNVGGNLYVTFAQQDGPHQNDVPGAGLGYVDVFNTHGKLLRRFAAAGPLDAPWGLTPISHGHFAGDVLVGNFGDGAVNVFNSHGRFLGAAQATNGQPLVIHGLWALSYGTGKDKNALFFTAGPNGEADGLFGRLAIQPLPHVHPATPTPAPTSTPYPNITRASLVPSATPGFIGMMGTGPMDDIWT